MKRFAPILLFLFLFGCTRKPQIDYGEVPDFSLTDQNGKTLTRADLAGRVWIADFIFTNCAGTCPMITGTMHRLQGALPDEVHFVSFSVDPERDTPEVLAEYAKKSNADKVRWHFLTGDKSKIYDLTIKGFKLALEDSGGTDVEPITHSTRLVLIDKQGRIRGYYGGTDDDDMKKLFSDATALL
jgi:cytochrome oxidase Cu insertion factor (SCO1/SenC/PrrC family)